MRSRSILGPVWIVYQNLVYSANTIEQLSLALAFQSDLFALIQDFVAEDSKGHF